MGLFSQTLLLLKKNVLLRYRHPGILILELIWPILIVGLISVMRLAVPPLKYGNCHYHPRAMPSAGAIPFIQTYLCNLDNPCYRSEQKVQSAQTTSRQFSAMTQDLGPLLSAESVLGVLEMSNQTTNVYTMIRKAVGNKEMLHGLDDVMNVGKYFRNPDRVKSILVDDYKLMTRADADALLNSRLNVAVLFNLTGTPDFKEIACNPENLNSFVDFPPGSEINEISSSLCNITEDQASGLANVMIQQLNIETILNSIKLLEEVKETFLDDHYPLSYAFESIAQMFEVITGSDEILKLLGTFAGIPDIANLIREIPQFVEGFQYFDSFMDVLKDIISNIEPIMRSIQEEDSPIWLVMKDAVKMSENFVKLTEGKWNGTSQEFSETINSLVQNLEKMTNDHDGQQFIAVFKFISKINWVHVYDEIIYTQTLSEDTIKHMLSNVQTMLEEMSVWHTIKDGIRLSEHALDVMSILTEKSIELRHALKNLFDFNDVMKKEINQIFAYGPTIMNTILEAFAKSDIFKVISDGTSYQNVCRKVLLNLQVQVTPDVYNDVENTLCSDDGDLSSGLANVFDSLKLNEIAAVINTTIHDFGMLYKGEFFHDNVMLVNMYTHYVRFTTALNKYLYDDYKWIEVFEAMSMDDIDLNVRGWEPFTDKLDENFLTTIFLNSVGPIGQAFVNSPQADEFAPLIHTMSEMVKLIYGTMSDINYITSMDSPLIQSANKFTKYMPEVFDGLSYMLENNQSAIIHLISSKDPLDTFCGEKYMHNMGMPAYIPVDEINALICNTEWDTVIANLTQPTKRIESMMTKMIKLMDMESNSPYDIEADWIQLEDYSERLFDMITKGQILGVIDMRTTTVKFFDQLDFTRMGEAMNSLERLMNIMIRNDAVVAMEILSKVMSSFQDDGIISSINTIMALVDISLDLQLESIKQQQNISNMMGMINMFPPKMKTMIILLAKAYPQFVSAVADVMYNPQKLTNHILSTGSKFPDCETSYVSDILMLSRDSHFHHFESFLCGLNFTELIIELIESQSSSYIDSIEKMISVFNSTSEVPVVDWQSLATKINEYNRLLMAPMSGQDDFDLSPFNFTAIGMSWDKFYSASNALEKLDMQKVEKILEDIQEIIMSMNDVNDTGLAKLIYSSLYINSQIMEVLQNELSFFNSSEVILFDFLGSEELKKLKSFLTASPDINAVGVATLSRLISNPDTVDTALDFEELCSNLTLFSAVFVVDASPMTPANIQKTICDAINSINITLVIEQFFDRPSFQKLANALETMSEDNLDFLKQRINGVAESSEKLNKLITHIVTNPPTIKLTDSDSVWMDPEVYAKEWEKLGEQLNQLTESNNRSPENISALVVNALTQSLKSMPGLLPNVATMIDKAVAVADIVMDELLAIINSDSLDEAFQEIPSLKPFIYLLNSLPEFFENILFTVSFHPEKISSKLNGVESFEDFCANNPEEIFSQAPKTSFDAKEFTDMLCSINMTLLDQLMQYKTANEVQNIIDNALSKPVNLTAVIEKTEKLINRVQDIKVNERVFNPKVWSNVMDNFNSWASLYGSDEEVFTQMQKTLTFGVIQYLQSNPENSEALHYIDAVLDIVGKRIENSLVDLKEAFKDFPTIETFMQLIDQAAGMIETILYTVFTQPQKTAAWSSALQSWSAFCSTPASNIMMAPPGSNFDVATFLAKMCTIDVDELVTELNTYQGYERIKLISMGNYTEAVNVTHLIQKMNEFFASLEDIYTDPMEIEGPELRLLNISVWKRIGKEMEEWLGDSGSNYGSDMSIADIINQLYWSTLSQFPEAQDIFTKMLAITNVITDQLMDLIKTGSVNSTLGNSASLQEMVRLTDNIPELIEVLIYTSQKHPEKLSSAINSFMSLDALCKSSPDAIFSIPPGLDFDLSSWFSQFCSLNVTDVESQLMNLKIAADIDSIINGTSSFNANVTSVVEKIDYLMKQFEKDLKFNDRFLNESVWSRVISNIEKWMNDPSILNNNAFGSVFEIFSVIAQLESDPFIKEQLRPLSAIMAVLDKVVDNLLAIDNETALHGQDLFARWQGMQKMLVFIQTPDVLDVLFALSSSQKFMSLFSEEGLKDFCDPSTTPSKYLTSPAGKNVNLQTVKSSFCDIDFDNFMDGFDSFIDIKAGEQIMNGTLDFNWKAFQKKMNLFIDLVTKWKKQPPELKFPSQWMNESYWQNLIDSDLEKGSTKDQIVSIINQMGPFLDTEGFKQFGMVLNSVMDILNMNIQSMQGSHYTLGSLIESIPAFKNIFDAIGVNSETLRSIALSPVKNATLFVQLFISDDVKKDFCNTDKWEKAVDFPNDFDTSGLFQTVCQNNIESLLNKLQDNFNLTNTLESLMDKSSHIQDWTEAASKIFTLIDNMEDLINNPPTLNAEETLSILADNYNTTNLLKLSGAFSAIDLMLFNSNSPFDTTGMTADVENIVGVIVGILDKLLARVKLQNGNLDIAAVFKDVPEVQNVIRGILDMKPDPLTGVFAVVLNADKINDFMSWSSDPSMLKELFCTKSTFEGVFQIRKDVNVDRLLKALCTIDPESVAEKLKDSFLPETTAKKNGFDAEKFSQNIEDMLYQITNLTMIKHVMFNGADLGKLLMINSSRLMEELDFNKLGDTVPDEYLTLSTQILNSILSEMHNMSEVKTLTSSLNFIVVYLESFNSFLRSIKDQPIELSMLLNNTEVGGILNPILTDPSILNGIVDMTVDVRKLSQLLEEPSPKSSLCGPELFEALHIPANELQTFQNLQTQICSADQSVMLWQTVMMQANGYFLYKQMDVIEREIQQGKYSLNTTAVTGNMQELISLMQSIIGQYVDGSKTFTDALDIGAVKRILEDTQKGISQKLLEASKSWSVDVADIIFPRVLDQAALLDMSKALNTVNLFMNLTIAQLKGMNDGSIDVADIFLRASDLQNLMKSYIRLGTNIAPAWSNQNFDADKMLQLFSNPSQVNSLCRQSSGISMSITSGSPPSHAVQDLSTVVCFVMGATLNDEVKEIIDYKEIGEMLKSIWDAPQATPQYSVFINNVDSFKILVEQLASKSYTISSSLLNLFNLHSTVDSLQNIAQNPQVIFRLLKLLGLGIEMPLSQDSEAVKALSQMNSFVLMPMVRLLEEMQSEGLTLTNVADNPNAFMGLMSVLVDFDVHFSVIKEFAVKPRINTLSKNRDAWCISQPYRDMVHDRLLAMNLPVTSRDVLSMICSEDSSKWIQKLEEMGLTNIQIEVVLDKMMLRADLFSMYDDQFRWVDLMSSMERLSSLISESNIKTRSEMADIQSAWNATKNLLFDKGFRSLFSYLELMESSSTSMDTDWAVFKQFLKFFSSVMRTINNNMDGFANKDRAVRLEDVLPDSKHVADLITEMIGKQNSAEFLATSIDPLMFYKLSLYNSWKGICNGTDDIRIYFHFPMGTDVEALKSNLCNAVSTRSSAFEEVLSLFGAKDMFKQLDMLVQQQWNDSRHANSVYDETHTAMMQLIKTLENVQHAVFHADSVDGYLQPIMDALISLGQSSQDVSICNAMVLYLNETQDYRHFHYIFSKVFTAFNLGSNMAKIVPDLDDLVCSLNDNGEINLKNFMEKLDSLGIVKNIQKAVEDLVTPLSRLECSAPVSFSETLMKVINSTQSRNSVDLGKMNSCVEMTIEESRNIISSASKFIDFMKTVTGVFQHPSIQDLMNNPELLSTFNFIVNALDANTEMILKFGDLIDNDAEVSSYLIDILKIPKAAVSSIMNATINQDWKNLFTKSVEMIEDILCNTTHLSEVLKLPEGSEMNVTEISQMLCTNEITNTVVYLKNASSSVDEIDKHLQRNDLFKVVASLTEDLANLITNFNDLIKLFVDLASGFNIDVFKSNVKMIDEIVQGKVMEDFGNSMKSILDDIRAFIAQDDPIQDIIHEIEKIINGIIAVEIIKRPFIETLEVKDLVVDLDALKAYMTQQLGFSEELSESILQSTYSTRVFFGLEDKPAYTCDEVFQMLLIMNGTSKGPDDISQAFCQLNDNQLKGLVNALKMELDIGDMIAKYVSYTKDSILATTQMTKEELNDMVENIDKSQIVIQQATDVFKRTPNGSQILDIFSDANADAFSSMNKLTPLMCGDKVEELFNIGFTSKLILSSPDNLAEDIQDGIDHNVDDLPNDFCVQIYENVRKSEIGSILWAYVKPILRGKILYTPDNEVTRAILKKANGTFSTLDEVHRIANIWAKETPNLMSMTVPVNETEGLRDALENDFIKGLLEATVGVSATNVLSGLDALQSNNFDPNDLTALQAVAEMVANFTSCIEVDRFVPVETEKDLEMEAYRLTKRNNYWAGIVFMNSEVPNQGRKKRQAGPTIPKHVTYKVRMDVDNVMDTTKLKSNMWKMSAEDNFVNDMRYLRGFVYIQDILDNAIIDLHKNPLKKTPGLNIKQMPFPCHHFDSFIFMLGSYLIPVMMTFVFLASLGTATHILVYDKENGQEQNLQVMGMVPGLHFITWFMSTMTIMTVVCVILAVMIKYTEIFIYSNAFIIFLFLLTFCFSTVMLLYMVSAFFTRTSLAILFVLMVYLISYLPYILVVSLELTMEYWQKNLACLASTTAFCFGAHSIGYLEESGKGVHWSNIRSESAKDFSMHWSCMMMLIDSALYFVIGWYVRQVKPGRYGVSQPWYFPLSPLYWCGCLKGIGNRYVAPRDVANSNGTLFESAPPGHEVGIEVTNLTKAYGKKKILHDLNINFYEGQINCLLGHNGAAKTTTLKLICGVLEPSSGSVRIHGMNPTTRNHQLGVCPQQNALFGYMSVLEHMKFYAGIKGTPIVVWTMMEIKKLLIDVDLWHVKNVLVQELSFGMKRRLCVALAFVGGSKTVVLDEPTSGVDPHARKNIWNLISSNRQGRTILMSTHHLDEADILSDRIAILHKGKLLCCGSATFLKRQIGGGFKLLISKFDSAENALDNIQPDSGVTNASILSYIQTMCPGASITDQMGTELVIELPKEESQMTVPLSVLFQELDHKAKDLGILNYGLTDTTVEDIFLQVTLQMDETNDDSKHEMVNPAMAIEHEAGITLPEDLTKSTDTGKNNPNMTSDKSLFKPGARIHHDISFQQDSFCGRTQRQTPQATCISSNGSKFSHRSFANKGCNFENHDTNNSIDSTKRNTGTSLLWSQVFALLIKRFHHYRRNWRILLTCFLLPLLVFLIALAFSTIRPDEGNIRPLVLDPVLYGKNTYTFLKQDPKTKQNVITPSEADLIALTFRNSSIGPSTSCMENIDQSYRPEESSCQKGSTPYDIKKQLYIIACTNARQEYLIVKGQHMIIQEQKLPNSLYLQNLDEFNVPSYILRTFKDYRDERFGGWSIEEADDDNNVAGIDPYAWFNSKGYHAMPSFLNGLSNSILRANVPYYENKNDYGITIINHPIKLSKSPLSVKTLENDAADAGISIMVVLAFSFIPCGFILYIINERIQKEKQLQQISGVGTAMYWIVSWIWDMFVYLIAVGIAVGIVCIFQTDSFYLRDNLSAFTVLLILYGWATIPYIYFISRFFKDSSTAYLVTFLLNLFLAMATVVSLLVMQLFRDDDVIWRCYKVCRYLFLIFPQFAIGQGLMDMVSSTVLYKLFLRFDEDHYTDPFSRDVTGWKLIAMAIFGFVFFILTLISEAVHSGAISISNDHHDLTSDIDEDVVKEKERIQHISNSDLLQVKDLSKVYRRGWKKFSAVDQISFGIMEGESFGLLGVNGAGKTTTFRMLTGDLSSSGGTIMFNGKKVSCHDRHFGQCVGYCPQEGGLDEYLTATETLHFHARLKGFDRERSALVVEQLLNRLGLKPFANIAVHAYSGGTKKKLALAVAMLGDPPILYLDEPTTGMDAGTRRLAWKCIEQANRNGQSVVLTSHSMDECDALCSRIAIMVNGQIKCIGSPQHLKSRFGDGYTAVVHSMKDNMVYISQFFLNQFPGAALRTKHFSSLEVMIPHSCGHIADILVILKKAQDEDMIEYYSLSQTTLDSVFVSFAQEQTDSFEDGTVANSSSIEDKSCTPRSSVSSGRPPSYDGPPQNKKDSPYIFSNPQYVVTEDEHEDGDAVLSPVYASNITFAAAAPVKSDDKEPCEIHTRL